ANLDREQEILMRLADMVIDVWASDSVLCRVEQLVAANGAEKTAPQQAIAQVVSTESYRRVTETARDLAGHIASNPAGMIRGVGLLAPYVPVDLITARRTIADHLATAGRYRF
ncbi:MAG: hypothetical protein KC620_23525, partial [Myxococcales bacterium]|nr:hypothetical protein [Myxococcales bacterium]